MVTHGGPFGTGARLSGSRACGGSRCDGSIVEPDMRVIRRGGRSTLTRQVAATGRILGLQREARCPHVAPTEGRTHRSSGASGLRRIRFVRCFASGPRIPLVGRDLPCKVPAASTRLPAIRGSTMEAAHRESAAARCRSAPRSRKALPAHHSLPFSRPSRAASRCRDPQPLRPQAAYSVFLRGGTGVSPSTSPGFSPAGGVR